MGACIVNEDYKIVGIGYNGFPKNCSDDILPWSRTSSDGSILNTKYPFGIKQKNFYLLKFMFCLLIQFVMLK